MLFLLLVIPVSGNGNKEIVLQKKKNDNIKNCYSYLVTTTRIGSFWFFTKTSQAVRIRFWKLSMVDYRTKAEILRHEVNCLFWS